MIRLIIGPSPRQIELPIGYRLQHGQGVTLRAGRDALLIGYGPVMLHEALRAADTLAEQDFGLQVVNLPWLNRVDRDWLRETVGEFAHVFILDDHAPQGGLGDFLLSEMMAAGLLPGRQVEKLAVAGFLACGTPAEVLQAHGLDGPSLAARILAAQTVA